MLTTVQNLNAMGVVCGATVTLKQRSPAYIIALGGDRLSLCQKPLMQFMFVCAISSII
ncbi:hypothetical protein IQ230_16085 [Gloeocapsopsis crepidinum LEGE 06123]|uniref:Ferrous iron transporter FeoA-like domain-containing protein n=1 Tax=Gloeocapsopsis crepidinum LEGE 06123 TaxID=588587 RepID=A0ABR9UUW4_9CHRO|nr:FeoA domain-containing protein [Gloeocapsopsis crepidinum]MBE9191840.1 hypothetical protein [Gloeocapsopsis crepidinum LEGE 06123]